MIRNVSQLALTCCVLLVAATCAVAAVAADLDRARLLSLQEQAAARTRARQGPEFERLAAVSSGPMGRLNADPRLELMAVTPAGRPLFHITHNLDAAITVGADRVWPGGATGLGLTGANAPGDLAIWDGGVVRASHQEFADRITVRDGGGIGDHATHVAGTMVAGGFDQQAGGMSPAAFLDTYDWTDDEVEMASAAGAGLHLSNHSYGWASGWLYGLGGDSNWYWLGDTTVSSVEDAGFGFYAGGTAEWDAIAHAAPRYLVVKSAGNDRDDVGPGPSGGHYVWDGDASDWAWSTDTRDPDGGDDGHDTLPYRGNAKNILTVGAVDDIPGGWSSPGDVSVTAFSGWGPTDDGRIKPDLVANGVALYSPLGGADDAYAGYSGTSMAAPGVTGSLNLLLSQYQERLGETPLASTLKAIVLHTTDEAGPAPGPDYRHGWGLLNTARAALLVDDHAAGGARIVEATLAGGATDTHRFAHDGGGPLVFTLAWTDPAGTPPAWSLDPDTPMLMNDVDLRVVREADGAVFRPWALDPATPDQPATTAANHRDNVETVDATGAGAGVYRVEIGHTGALSGPQAYSLVQTGGSPVSATAVGDAPPTARLLGAAPNPFNPRTEILLSLARAGAAAVDVYDLRGRKLAVLHAGDLPAGRHRLAWDGRADDGRRVAGGVYLVRLRTAEHQESLRITLVK